MVRAGNHYGRQWRGKVPRKASAHLSLLQGTRCEGFLRALWVGEEGWTLYMAIIIGSITRTIICRIAEV